jgi:hypothetical protein
MPGDTSLVYHDALADALDQAINMVAIREYGRLRAGLSDNHIRDEVERSLASFRDLKEGTIPEYNSWDALLYATWFQPGHVNLAYAVAALALEGAGETVNGFARKLRLQVVDFGCGALAMQFGVALAAAGALGRGQQIDRIGVQSMDSSGAMIAIGRDIWRQFVRMVAADPRLEHLSRACDVITSDTYTISAGVPPWSQPSIQPDAGAERWLTAMHAVYDETSQTVRDALSGFAVALRANATVLTSHLDKATLLEYVMPFGDYSRHLAGSGELPYRINPQRRLTAVTEFRNMLFAKYFGDDPHVGDHVRYYLAGAVDWSVRDAVCYLHKGR